MLRHSNISSLSFRFLITCCVTATAAGTLTAATLCVNKAGSHGCYSTIAAAVSHASAGDTINVGPGTYKEDVIIGKSLYLIAKSSSSNNHDGASVVIDATGLANGIYIDGIDNPGLRDVSVSGFTVKNANFEGILITNASSITISDNRVIDNDQGLNISNGTCPGIPVFETAEAEDCGEGIHLSGVDHSIVDGNTVEKNSGGILISDDTGATHHNLITRNLVRNNPFDCGITLASHPPAALTHSPSPLGIFQNTIAGNESSHNGYQIPGAGAGIGMFSFLPGGRVSGNVAIHNRLTNNGLPGVTFHAHSPGENLSNNLITSNYIAGNGADTEDAATPGPTGINIFGVSAIAGTIISLNVIDREINDVVVNTPAEVDVHLNNLLGHEIGVNNLGPGTADATLNWWGCPGGPEADACSRVGGPVLFTPWLTKPF
jgi:parallel beta-helix repeat protein